MGHPVEAAWAKLDRARRHARELQALLSPIVHGSGFGFRREQDGSPSKLVFRPVNLPIVGPQVSAAFGDFLNNTRAALDHLAWQLTSDGERQSNPKAINFPIYESSLDARGRSAPARIRGVTDPVVAAAVDAVQPYQAEAGAQRDRHPLRVLNHLCNIDKHRALVLAVVALEPRGIWWGSSEGDAPVVGMQLWPGELKDGDAAIRFDFGNREPPLDFDPNLEIQVKALEQFPGWDGSGHDLLSLAASIYWHVEFRVLADHFAPIFGAPVRHWAHLLAE
jgi:hypothetical protein